MSEHSVDYAAGRITPEGRARLDKFGSTLDAGNVRLLCERIADYPEVLAAAAKVLDRAEAASALRDVAADLYRNHDMPPNKDGRSYSYRMGWWDGVHHAAKVVERAARVTPRGVPA